MLPAYRESLHLRYPPVCEICLPLVEEEIQKKDQMARTKALGAWLKDSKGKERQRRVSGGVKGREKITVEILFWRLRGFLWISTMVLSMVGNFRGVSLLNLFIVDSNYTSLSRPGTSNFCPTVVFTSCSSAFHPNFPPMDSMGSYLPIVSQCSTAGPRYSNTRQEQIYCMLPFPPLRRSCRPPQLLSDISANRLAVKVHHIRRPLFALVQSPARLPEFR